jgi:hypothetical protein
MWLISILAIFIFCYLIKKSMSKQFKWQYLMYFWLNDRRLPLILKNSGIQEFRNSGIQEYRNTGIQEYH